MIGAGRDQRGGGSPAQRSRSRSAPSASVCRPSNRSALARDPRILILDEATSSVDPETEKTIERAVGRVLAGRTSIVVAHRLSTIVRADRILVLSHGEVKESGTHGELLEKGGLYARLYALQLKDREAAA